MPNEQLAAARQECDELHAVVNRHARRLVTFTDPNTYDSDAVISVLTRLGELLSDVKACQVRLCGLLKADYDRSQLVSQAEKLKEQRTKALNHLNTVAAQIGIAA